MQVHGRIIYLFVVGVWVMALEVDDVPYHPYHKLLLTKYLYDHNIINIVYVIKC